MILITRPKPEAKKLCQELSLIGAPSHIDSLSAIVTKRKKIKVKKNHAVLISSPRAAKIFSTSKSVSKKVPLLIIGKVSEGLLIRAKFQNIIKTFQDSTSLISHLKRNKKSIFGEALLTGIDHKTGTISNQSIQKKITALGIMFQKDEIYKTSFKKKLNDKTIKLLKSNSIKFAILYSQENARVLIELMNSAGIKQNSNKIHYVCLSKQIAKIMKNNGLTSCNPSKPSQSLLIKMIIRLLNNSSD